MKLSNFLLGLLLFIGAPTVSAATIPAPSHKISYPAGWQNWAVIAVSHRTDNNTLRVILGNEIAVKAARLSKTNPWPDGTVLGKVVWKDTVLSSWKSATVPGKFVHVEFMLKDSKKYSKTHGWGWARWVGPEQKPFNKGMRICISCHTPVKDRDWVFTKPAQFPKFK